MIQYDWYNCPPDVKEQVDGFTRRVAHLLADNLMGIYLHGSLAMGCFNPRQSDLDLLVITQRSMRVDIKRQLAELLLATSCAPRPIEISFVVYSDLIPWQYPTPFDLHYSEMWRQRYQEALDTGRWQSENVEVRTDPDLAAHITITKKRGICLQGSPIVHVFPDVPGEDYLASILADVKDALAIIQHDPTYAILNACRVCAFVRDSHIYSKQEGGAWALTVVPEALSPVVASALEMYATGQQRMVFDPVALSKFVSYMRQQLPL